ncbi:hypothetical protein KJ632_05150 [Patescibacteria group bacterium]|nr:hypothetical protein [Patescibacteria group bacterium]
MNKTGKLQKNPNVTAFDKAQIYWTSYEHIPHQRGVIWKICAALVVLGGISLSLYYGVWTLAMLIGVASVVYFLYQLEEPRQIDVKISDIGIKVGNRKYSFARIKAFWLHYEPPYTSTLNIRVQGDFLRDISIFMPIDDPALIRSFLIKKVPELEGQKESLTDILLRLLKI